MIHSRGRGIEYEIAINTLPASVNIDYHHKLVSQALAGLMKKGYVTKMGTKPSSPNGGVIYDDLAHLEVSTPTYTDPFDAVIYDKVSEVYALGGAQEASKLEAKRVVVHKTNYSTFSSNFLQRIGLIQSELTSYATHGNSTIQRASVRDWTTVLKALIPNYLARIIFMGSGDIIPGYGFVLSPRAMFVAQESSLDTMKSRGIVNERCWKAEMGRNYCDSEKFMRLHDIHYEGLRCDWNVWIRDAWQTYVISAFEKGLLADPPKISDPVRAIRTTSQDHEGNWKIEGTDGKKMDLVTDILRGYYWDKIRPMLEEEGDIADKICIGQIEYMLDKLESRSIETFKDYGIDWITKKDWLNEYGLMEAVKSDTKMSEGMRVCRAFAWIDPTVLYYVGEKINFEEYECLFDPVESISFAKELIPWFDWEGIPKRILHALENGPDGSRDYFSSEILKMFSSKIVSRSWDNICFSNWRIELPDPLMLSKQYLDSEEITIGSLEDVRNLFQKTYPQLISSDAISER